MESIPFSKTYRLLNHGPTVSGQEFLEKDSGDKFAAFGLKTFAAAGIAVPLVEDCAAWLECRLIREPHMQENYNLFRAEIVGAHADERVFSDGRWHFEGHDDMRPLHHIAGDTFFTIGVAIS